MNYNLERKILIRISDLNVGQTISIEELYQDFQEVSLEDFISLIVKLSIRYYIMIEGKYSMECYKLEKYHKIIGLDRGGVEIIDYLKNEKIWNKVDNYLRENDYQDLPISLAFEFAKEVLKKEFNNILK